jgi:hypothetical protein
MSPRVSLPGADELFRATSPRSAAQPDVPEAPPSYPPPRKEDGRVPSDPTTRGLPTRRSVGERASTGRERHEEKITVYVSATELVDLERARLALRAEHGIAIDRGRIVREALSVLLADFEAKHGDSILVRRLAGS